MLTSTIAPQSTNNIRVGYLPHSSDGDPVCGDANAPEGELLQLCREDAGALVPELGQGVAGHPTSGAERAAEGTAAIGAYDAVFERTQHGNTVRSVCFCSRRKCGHGEGRQTRNDGCALCCPRIGSTLRAVNHTLERAQLILGCALSGMQGDFPVLGDEGDMPAKHTPAACVKAGKFRREGG